MNPNQEAEIRGIRTPQTTAVFEALLPSVILQLVTTEQARESYQHLVNAMGESAPGPLAALLPGAWRADGLSTSREGRRLP